MNSSFEVSFASLRCALALSLLLLAVVCSSASAALPVGETPPAISGTAWDGETLTTDNGTWSIDNAELYFTYQWNRCELDHPEICTEIAGATENALQLGPDDVNWKIRVVVTATGFDGSGEQISFPAGPVNALAPANTVAPTVSGDTTEGQTLTIDPGTWTGTPVITFEYAWYRCDADGFACVWLEGQTGQNYVLTADDVGHTLNTGVAASNGGGVTGVFGGTSGVVSGLPADPNQPVISGATTQGETLTTSNGLWPGLYPDFLTYEYQWARCDAAGNDCAGIVGAYSQSYELTPDDVGYRMRATVTANDGEISDTQNSLPSAVVTSINTPPVVTGTATDGDTLTTTNGTWSMPGALTYTYAWYRCSSVIDNCVPISGATGTQLVLTPDEVGHRIVAVVAATNGEDYNGQGSEGTALVQAAPPVNSVVPTIEGDPAQGQTMTAGNGDWTGTPEISFTYQWNRCNDEFCEEIDLETGATYTPTSGDVGWYLMLAVTATNAGGSSTAFSAPTTAVLPNAPIPEGSPEVSGDPTEGATVTTTNGDWVGAGPITYTYQWLRCDPETDDCVAIEGATDQDYVLTSDDVGQTVTAIVTATNAGGSNSAAASPPIGPIAALTAPSVSEVPAVTGTPTDDFILTVSNGVWDSYETPVFTYQWKRCDSDGSNCVDIVGATGSTLDLTPADVGHQISAVVTATNATGANSSTSNLVGPISGVPLAVTLPASNVTAEGAQLNGTVDSRYADTGYVFEWGTDANDLSNNHTDGAPAGVVGAAPFSFTLTDLAPSTTYYFKLSAHNEAGDGAGEILSFTTTAARVDPPPTPPTRAADPPAKFAVGVAVSSQTMEHATFAFTLPGAGSGTFSGRVENDKRHVGSESNGKGSTGKTFSAFSRSFIGNEAGRFDLPAKLTSRALDFLRDRGFLRVSMTAKYTPTAGGETQTYKQVVKLRPYAITAFGTAAASNSVTATVRTPRTGKLSVTFLLRNRTTGESTTVKSFAGRDRPGGSYDYSAGLSPEAQAAIGSGEVNLMVKSELKTQNYSSRMLRSRFVECDFCD